MEASPLTQQARPETFKPKIVELYETLFKNDGEEPEFSEGFWTEFFLLRPDRGHLQSYLEELTAEEILQLQVSTRQLFSRAIEALKAAKSPADQHSLETLVPFLIGVLNKKYTNPNAEVIALLAGFDEVDRILPDFIAALDVVIRNGATLEMRRNGIEVALSMISGAYQTGLVTYFTHRDLFPALMKYIHDCEDPDQTLRPFLTLGLLANYNKFEFQNPYRLRLDDFVNEATIQKIIRSVGRLCAQLRNDYVEIQDDLPEGWSLSGAISFLSFGYLSKRSTPKQALSPEDAKAMFAALPEANNALMLATYDFVNANKLFCSSFIKIKHDDKNEEMPINSFLSFTSYLLQHAYRSNRTSLYAYLNLIILRIIVEDPASCKYLVSEDSKTTVRLCRQRQPYLPVVQTDRALVAIFLDILLDAINHNLRRRLDVELYVQSLEIILRIISFLSRSRIHLPYHWSELWRSLLSFMRFLSTYSADLSLAYNFNGLLKPLVTIIALALSSGESFLPDAAAYDDLFYKIVETGPILLKFQEVFNLNDQKSEIPMDVIMHVSNHYHVLLETEEGKDLKNLSPREVQKIIKKGYDTLNIPTREDLGSWTRYREADEKSALKKIARVAMEDTKKLLKR